MSEANGLVQCQYTTEALQACQGACLKEKS